MVSKKNWINRMLHSFFSNFWVKFNQLTSQRMLSATAVSTAGIQSGAVGGRKKAHAATLSAKFFFQALSCDPWKKEATF